MLSSFLKGVTRATPVPLNKKSLIILFGLGLNIDRKSTRLNSSHDQNSYAVFCLKNKINSEKEKAQDEWDAMVFNVDEDRKEHKR